MVDIATTNYSSRNGAKVIWVAIHTTEGIMDARDLGFYWQRINNGSSHAGCDNSKTVTYVDTKNASWTLLNGNSKSVNMEICGWARWTREEWLGPQRGRLVQAANWTRQMCDKFGIPKRYIGAAGVTRGEAGIIGHVDYTYGAKDGDHTDPGRGFPWDVFIQIVNEGDDDMALFDQATKNAYDEGYHKTMEMYGALIGEPDKTGKPLIQRHIDFVVNTIVQHMDAQFAALSARLAALETGGVDEETIGKIAVDAIEKKLEN